MMSDTTKQNNADAEAGQNADQGADQTAAHVEPIGEHDLALTKNGQRYVFQCAPGREAQTLNQIAEMVTRNDTELTWFDAAVLSHQLGERMSQRLADLGTPRLSA